jgi:glucose uptake protein GlcU
LSAKRFNSKIDRWIVLVLISVVLLDFAVIGVVAVSGEDPLVSTGIIPISLLTVALIVSLLLGTHYTVNRNLLRIRSGPFWFNVQIDQIESVKASRSPLSSPAMSMDRLLIRYDKRRRIMVSPADKIGFLKAIGQELTEK